MTTSTSKRPVALITGAAGGIGAATAAELAADGWVVAGLDRAVLSAAGPDVRPYRADIAVAEDVERIVVQIENDLGPIAGLVNCAGVMRPGSALTTTDTEWDETFAVNARGTFLVCRSVVSRMTARGAGAVVTVASNAAATPRTDMAAYGASKAAAEQFTKSLGLEAARYGVRCNVVSPGSTRTPMLLAVLPDGTPAEAPIDGAPGQFKLGIPLGKIAEPRDIARVVAFLLSDAAGHITLETVTVDGGATLGR